jgi:DNA-binding FadR family transcriptional regulator
MQRTPSRVQRGQGVMHAVLTDLGKRILSGELASGTIVGNEAALMAEHAVSRTAIREAVKTLAGKGLLETRPKTGTRVLPSERWNMLDRDVLAWLLAAAPSIELMRQLHEIRCVIEPEAAALAAERASAAELARLRKCCDRMDAAGDDVRAFTEADLEFHTAVLTATRNPFIITFASGIRASLLAFFRVTGQDPDAFESGRPRHRRLMRALERRNPKKARAASRVVLEGARQVIEHLERSGGWPEERAL